MSTLTVCLMAHQKRWNTAVLYKYQFAIGTLMAGDQTNVIKIDQRLSQPTYLLLRKLSEISNPRIF